MQRFASSIILLLNFNTSSGVLLNDCLKCIVILNFLINSSEDKKEETVNV